ncbi:PAS domain S-box protein [Spirosoma taeanense]|uniref:histidine kinase n=1 Tax=Spirosoma taeanense TaxID=2735870 RepID=A0A6M5YAD5_9BACT|nr:PAS domain S-box protein [Spirosoma taeanense]QJW91158.1 PAS domain S-box protein [Spirosoma taeanense]
MTDNQKPTNKELTAAGKRFVHGADVSPACLWEWDLRTNQIWQSERFRQVFGQPTSKDSPEAAAWHDRIHPDDKESVTRHLLHVVEQGGEWAAEYRFRRVDGSYAHVYGQGYTMPDTGKATRMTGYLTEVSGRVQPQPAAPGSDQDWAMALESAGTVQAIPAERRHSQTLREIEKHLPTAFDNAVVGIVVTTTGGKFIQINQAFGYMIGYSPEELVNGSFSQVIHPDDQDRYQKQLTELMTGGLTSLVTQIRCLHRAGSVVWISLHTTRIHTEPDREQRVFSIVQDVTQDVATRDAQQKMLTLVDNSVELMSVLEMDGKNSYINKAGLAMLGFDSEQQMRDTPIEQLHAPEHFLFVEQQVLPSVMSTGRWSGEMLVRHLKTGEIFPVFNNTIRIDDPYTGHPLAIGAVMRDMRPEMAAQQALVESEARFRNMIMQSPLAIGLLRGENLVIESANELILSLWGKTDTIIGQSLLTALPEIQGQGFVELLESVYQTGQPYYGYETLARLHRNGQLEDAYFNFVYAPVRENEGAINGVMVVATEVTAQVQAKKELEESEKRFRNLVLDAPMATAVYTGRDMVIQLANDAMLKLWGKGASVIGKKLRDALPELDGQPFYDLLNTVYTTGVAYQGTEDRADLVVDGKLQTFYFNFTYKPLRDAEGHVYAILNMAVDITYQVTAKQQFQEAQESLREAVDLAELAPWTTNLLTGEMICSERVNNWLGVSERITPEIVGRCIHEKDQARVNRIAQAAMNPSSGGKMELEYTVVHQQTQEERILRTQARVLFTEQGLPYLIRGTSQDITAHRITEQALEKQVQLRTEELIKSNSQLKQSNQELERYAYVASHDLQEPLRKIQMYSSLIRERYLQDISSEGRNHLIKIEESANRMSVLIKNILDFSRINHESGFLNHVDLHEVVEDVVRDFDLLLTQKNGRVDVGELCAIPAIPLQMTQLFYNLIANSLKFTQEGVPPVITIASQVLTAQELRAHEKLNPRIPYCKLSVSDNGIGFNPAFVDKIFGLFQRLHHQQQYEGTGIGLSLCQRIVFNHQGEIWAESEEGKGATFHIILPMSR